MFHALPNPEASLADNMIGILMLISLIGIAVTAIHIWKATRK